jgi:hypothetical protein
MSDNSNSAHGRSPVPGAAANGLRSARQPMLPGFPKGPGAPAGPAPDLLGAAEEVADIYRALFDLNKRLGPLSQKVSRDWYEANILRQLSDQLNLADLLTQQAYTMLAYRGRAVGIDIPGIGEAPAPGQDEDGACQERNSEQEGAE